MISSAEIALIVWLVFKLLEELLGPIRELSVPFDSVIVDQEEVNNDEIFDVASIDKEFWKNFRKASISLSKIFREVRNEVLFVAQLAD